MDSTERQMMLDTFQGIFFAIGRLSKVLPEDVHADLVANMLMCATDPTCPHMTRQTVKAIVDRMTE